MLKFKNKIFSFYHLKLFIGLGIIYSFNSQIIKPCSACLCRAPSECEILNNGTYVCHCIAGIKGKYCDKLLEKYDSVCGSSPCWSGGTCIGNTTHWNCICPPETTGLICKDLMNKSDLEIKILNKGWYVAKLTLYYKRIMTGTILYKQTGSIAIGQDYAFYMPYDTVLSSTVLVAHAIAGTRIMSVKIENNIECFHVWGTTQFPAWSRMPCW